MSESQAWLELSFYLFVIVAFIPLMYGCKKLGGWAIDKLCPGYPVSYKMPNGKVKTFYLEKAGDVLDFYEDPRKTLVDLKMIEGD